eukprot:NODE_7111_length_605_cov_3.600418_g7088_i0.p1 GENE.NODE_7111_length_605_cov_3.600418_g7088_i0~~NODE_7111_length_605_cov_3.600418_g7088_i0.p1  ORF type:complete len:165 (+),score=45.16 NODE_7111_length_605_cov_3.600418_g7088_i0:70-564(+)
MASPTRAQQVVSYPQAAPAMYYPQQAAYSYPGFTGFAPQYGFAPSVMPSAGSYTLPTGAYQGASVVSASSSLPSTAAASQLAQPAKATPERVEKLLELCFTKMEGLGNQLRQAAAELEELRAEVVTANNICDSELRSQLQQANDEIYKLREQLSEAAERKANKL